MKERVLKMTVYAEKDLAILMPDFLANRKKDLANIEIAIAQENWAEIRRIGHLLNGVCGGYGFDDLGELGQELESLSLERKLKEIQDICVVMKNYLKDVKVVFT